MMGVTFCHSTLIMVPGAPRPKGLFSGDAFQLEPITAWIMRL